MSGTRGEEPPGLAGEPDLRPFHGAPLLLVYGAPGCAAVLPAQLPTRTLPALLLRNGRGRWRFEHNGALDADGRLAASTASALPSPP